MIGRLLGKKEKKNVSAAADSFFSNGGEVRVGDASCSSDSDDEMSDCSDVHSTSSHDSAPQQIAIEESSSVGRWKCALSFMLLAVAVILVVSAQTYLSNEERLESEHTFGMYAGVLRKTLIQRKNVAMEALKATSSMITSAALASDQSWPFVTIPHVEKRFENLRSETFTDAIIFAPMVDNVGPNTDENSLWVKYAKKQQGWIDESLSDYQDLPREYQFENLPPEMSVSNKIYGIKDGVVEETLLWRPSVPLWQISPPPIDRSIINYDLFSNEDFFTFANAFPIVDTAVWSGITDVNGIFSRVISSKNRKPDSNLNKTSHSNHSRKIQQNELYVDELWEFEDEVMDINDVFSKSSEYSLTLQQSQDELQIKELFFQDTKPAQNTPYTLLLEPIYSDHDNFQLVGILVGVFSWDAFFSNIFSENDLAYENLGSIIAYVSSSTCDGNTFIYRITGEHAEFLGFGDERDRENYIAQGDTNVQYITLFDSRYVGGDDHCKWDVLLYATDDFNNNFLTTVPWRASAIVGVVFIITFIMFAIFINLVDKRQEKVMTSASRANAVVKSLFPRNVRDRILKDAEEQVTVDNGSKKTGFFAEAAKKKLKSFLDEERDGADGTDDDGGFGVYKTKPIADLFPEATVLFADIVGFTAWSSVREPSQVFQLLETIYHSFDTVAKRRRVFKVETIGDCYLAVTGLPDPRKDHAVVMARFARECMIKMITMTKKLEVSLGPDTCDLSMRFGLHSGPVTAGVLRGEKSRFQLFGDTVNTAARMESNGAKGRIHISEETANLLIDAGKTSWVTEREGRIKAKGKGELKTFWLQNGKETDTGSVMTASSSKDDLKLSLEAVSAEGIGGINSSVFHTNGNANHLNGGEYGANNENKQMLSPKLNRLVDWNVDQLSRLLRLIVVRRKALRRLSNSNTLYDSDVSRTGTVLEEVREVITLPNFDANTFRSIESPDSIELPTEVMTQLHDYVSKICMMYRNVHFHNFEHASHVTMSVSKLLARIVAPDEVMNDENASNTRKSTKVFASALHDHTYGITSDPLTQFACVFSALIHDVDHTGVPNTQLVKESTTLARRYKNKSVAEQNSVDLAWELLMDKDYDKLRSIIYASESEFHRFRQLVVNSVMATDIADKELKVLRNNRWSRAFNEKPMDENADDDRNRKATIVIEHLIQASDIAHTMQHWQIYRKWNERLFKENYLAYRMGRAENDPSISWYKGEIGFFDFYIIPLAKKLKDCGVFGVSSDEYLNYAVKNRAEWEVKGKDIVKNMKMKVENQFPPVQTNTNNQGSSSQFPPSHVQIQREQPAGCATAEKKRRLSNFIDNGLETATTATIGSSSSSSRRSSFIRGKNGFSKN